MTRPSISECTPQSVETETPSQPISRNKARILAAELCTTAVIPAKPLTLTKSRLAPCLSNKERVQISHHMLLHTIRVTRNIIERVVVVSRDPTLLRAAEMEGATPLVEQGTDLNEALYQATDSASSAGAEAVLVLPADLPLLTIGDVAAISNFAATCPVMAIAPSWPDGGTNALLLRPPSIHVFSFGPDSFARHCSAARECGIEPNVFWSDTLALDLDTPRDWDVLCARAGATSFEELIALLDSPPPTDSTSHRFLDNLGTAP